MNKKKLLALVLAALMSVSTTVVAFADESTPASAPVAVTPLNQSDALLDEDDVITAVLHDTSDTIADDDLYNQSSYSAKLADGTVTVKVSGLRKHKNGNGSGSEGYWVGFALLAPDGANYMKYSYKGGSMSKVYPVEQAVDGGSETGIAFYYNAETDPKTDVASVQWFSDAEGETPVGDTWTVNVDLNGVEIVPADATPVKDESSLKEALEKGGYVMLTQDITLTSAQTISKDTTLDLNGCKLTVTSNGDEDGNTAGLTVKSGVTATITDSKEIGEIKNNDSNYVLCNEGTMILSGGVQITAFSTDSGAVGNFGNLTVENASVKGGRFSFSNGGDSILVVNDGHFETESTYGAVYGNTDTNITLNGGTFTAENSKTAVEMASGNLVVKEGAVLTVSSDAEAGDVFKFTDAASSTVKMDSTVVVNKGTDGESISTDEIANAVKENGGSASVVDPSEEEENDRECSGGDYFGNQKWAELKAQIAKAEDGDTIEMSGTGLPWFPSSVARALKGKDVTLEIRKNGVTYTLNGQKIGPITKIWYNFDENLETTLQPVEE